MLTPQLPVLVYWQEKRPDPFGSYSRASFIQSLAVSAALKPVVSYLGQDSSAAAQIWTHNMWWLGNGLGYVPLTE